MTVDPGGGRRSRTRTTPGRRPRKPSDGASVDQPGGSASRSAAHDRGVDRDNQKADQPYAAERGRGQRRRLIPLRGAQQRPGPAETCPTIAPPLRAPTRSAARPPRHSVRRVVHRSRQQPVRGPAPRQPQRAEHDGQHHKQRTGARQQPVLGGQHVAGHTAPRPHTRHRTRSARRAPPTATGQARPRPATTMTGRERRGRAARRRATPLRGPKATQVARRLGARQRRTQVQDRRPDRAHHAVTGAPD